MIAQNVCSQEILRKYFEDNGESMDDNNAKTVSFNVEFQKNIADFDISLDNVQKQMQVIIDSSLKKYKNILVANDMLFDKNEDLMNQNSKI